MPKIDFYLLPEGHSNSRFNFVCRLIEKIYKLKHRIYIHTKNQTDAHLLDELLWTYREDSFLPHNLYGEGPEPPPPIQIGYEVVPEKHRDILINLSNEIPSFYTQFQRVLECIPSDSEMQARARDHYRFYKAAGYIIKTHKLQSVEA